MPAGAVVAVFGQNQSQAFARLRLTLHQEAGPLMPTAHLRTEQDAQHDATIVVARIFNASDHLRQRNVKKDHL
jgi:hypothetical protein